MTPEQAIDTIERHLFKDKLWDHGICEAWQTLKAHCTQPASVQQLKPKMPSFEEAVKTIGDIPTGVASPASFISGMSVMYDYIARHFGR